LGFADAPERNQRACRKIVRFCGSRTCKPNSVRRIAPAGRSFLWAAHYCAALATYPEVVTRRASTCDRQADAPPLFGLAPCGVFPATTIASGAVRSYRTFSPLPRLRKAVYFLWHFPSPAFERRRPDVIRHTALWSSDFPLPIRYLIARRSRATGIHGLAATVRPSS
jgi:hypothetical protein